MNKLSCIAAMKYVLRHAPKDKNFLPNSRQIKEKETSYLYIGF